MLNKLKHQLHQFREHICRGMSLSLLLWQRYFFLLTLGFQVVKYRCIMCIWNSFSLSQIGNPKNTIALDFLADGLVFAFFWFWPASGKLLFVLFFGLKHPVVTNRRRKYAKTGKTVLGKCHVISFLVNHIAKRLNVFKYWCKNYVPVTPRLKKSHTPSIFRHTTLYHIS